jgi:hypothetical protein
LIGVLAGATTRYAVADAGLAAEPAVPALAVPALDVPALDVPALAAVALAAPPTARAPAAIAAAYDRCHLRLLRPVRVPLTGPSPISPS